MISAKVILDSISTAGIRLVTMELKYPRFIHGEVMTHRDRARNSASSRAIPWRKWKDGIDGVRLREGWRRGDVSMATMVAGLDPRCMMAMIMSDPVVPLSFDGEQRGMQSGEAVACQERARGIWLAARDEAVIRADELWEMGIHKSLVNRIVEPWMWMTTLMTASEWANLLRLRDHDAAEKHFRVLARAIRVALEESIPVERDEHAPYLMVGEAELEDRALISAARCARVSYLNHEGTVDLKKDRDLAQRLINPSNALNGDKNDAIHASPFEHVAIAGKPGEWSGPFHGWIQFRKTFKGENVSGIFPPS